MNQLKRLWYSISQRERAMVSVGVAGVLAIVLYSLVWAPWQQQLQRLRDQVPAKRQTLAWMEQAAREAAPLLKKRKDSGSGDQNLPILTIVEQTATAMQLRDAIKQMRPGDNNEVQVNLQEAEFDTWLKWIDALSKQGIEIGAAAAGRGQDPGKANIRMTLGRE